MRQAVGPGSTVASSFKVRPHRVGASWSQGGISQTPFLDLMAAANGPLITWYFSFQQSTF
eukprot:6273737-Pyramimonas_sp.AAC.1